MEQAYERLLPNGPLLDFFWSWRFLVRSVLAVTSTPLPPVARVLCGRDRICRTGRQLRRAGREYAVARDRARNLHQRASHRARCRRLAVRFRGERLRSSPPSRPSCARSGSNAFQSFSRIGYAVADVITTQYRANQSFQRADGAPNEKLRIIPNGIDVAKFAAIPRDDAPRRPTVVMIGRIVPIKDIRTFIMAVALLKDLVPNVLAILIGPEDEDPEYAAELPAAGRAARRRSRRSNSSAACRT